MPLQKHIRLIIFLLVFQLNAQKTVLKSTPNDRQKLEAVLNQEKSFEGDPLEIKKHLHSLKETKYYNVVYDAILADEYSNTSNVINKKSDFHYLRSIENAILLKEPEITIWAQLNYLSYLYHYRDYAEMTPLLLKVINEIKQVPSDKIILPGQSFKKIGWIMQTLGDYDASYYYLNLSLKHTPKNSKQYNTILYSIGINYLNTSDLTKAESYFLQSASLAHKMQDKIRYAKAIGELAILKHKRGDSKTAISLLKKDILISKTEKNDQNTMYALIQLATIYIAEKDFINAENALNDAQNIAKTRSYLEKSELQIIQLKLKILQQQNRTDNELYLRRRMIVLEDSLQNKDGEIAINKANWLIQKEKFEQNLKKTNAKYHKETSLKNLYAAIIILVFAVLFIVFFSSRKHLKKRKLEYNQKVSSFNLEKIKTEKKLSDVNESLTIQTQYLKGKNNQIENLKAEIEKIKESVSKESSEKENGNLNLFLESHLMTENNWKNFKKNFKKNILNFIIC